MARWFTKNKRKDRREDSSMESAQQQSSKETDDSQINNSSNVAPEASSGLLGFMRQRLQKTVA